MYTIIIGERERANLVVQLARFFSMLSVCRVVFPDFTILRRPRCTVNRSNFTYIHFFSRMRKHITTIFYALRHAHGSYLPVLQLAGLRVVGGRLALHGFAPARQ